MVKVAGLCVADQGQQMERRLQTGWMAAPNEVDGGSKQGGWRDYQPLASVTDGL